MTPGSGKYNLKLIQARPFQRLFQRRQAAELVPEVTFAVEYTIEVEEDG